MGMAKSPSLPANRAAQPDDPRAEAAGTALTRVNEIREKVEETIGPLVQGGQARVQVVERVTQMMSAEVFRGPIPHPKHIQAYEDACPGAADRIIRMAETAQQRREDREDKLIQNEYDDRRIGLYLGFFSLLSMVLGGIFLVYNDKVLIGGSLLGAAVLGTVVGSFVHGRRPNGNNDSEEQIRKK
jgi:uncharacterized membrane protein